MFDGFTDEMIDCDEALLRVRHGGCGPPVLLFHGHPRTGTTWHRWRRSSYRRLQGRLPGPARLWEYRRPPFYVDHVSIQTSDRPRYREADGGLGHTRFAVVGHDRGCYVASGLALDHPGRVGLVVLDGVPIVEALAEFDARFAQLWCHWFFWQAGETRAGDRRDPDAWYRNPTGRHGRGQLRRLFRRHGSPVVHAMMEDYRAGLGIDLAQTLPTAGGPDVRAPPSCSVECDDLELLGDPFEIWRHLGGRYSGRGVDSGHHMAEENPRDLAAALINFLR